ncbi:MAG TPA: hypothetical protein VGB43_08660 [Flavobacterium sp.]|jgi:hypothetical protein
MKKFDVILTIFLLLFVSIAQAQKSNTTAIPLVDPVTNCELRYYYFPNIEAFFDTKKRVYHFMEQGVWTTAEEIPSGYRGYSIYNKASVFITDYDGDDPIQFIAAYKKKYPHNLRGKYREMTASIDN